MDQKSATCSKYVNEQNGNQMEVDGSKKSNLFSIKISESSKSSKFYCEMCHVECNSEKTYENHCNSRKHQKIKKTTIKISEPLILSNRVLCEICEVYCSSKKSYEEHCEKPIHYKKERIKRRIEESAFECVLCNKSCNNQYMFDLHLKGGLHKRNQIKKDLQLMPPTKRLKLNESYELKLGDEIVDFIYEYQPNIHFCTLCNFEILSNPETQPENLDIHAKSQKHKKMLKSIFNFSIGSLSNDQMDLESKMKKISDQDKNLLKKYCEIILTCDELKIFEEHTTNIVRSLEKISTYFQIYQFDSEELNLSVFRVGLFGKKLMLKDDKVIDIVLLCSVKPTVEVLKKIVEYLRFDLVEFKGEYYEIQENIEDALITIKTKKLDLLIQIKLTSYLFENELSEEMMIEEEQNNRILDKNKCLNNLLELKRMKWYKTKIQDHFNQSFTIVISILRYFTDYEPKWRDFSWNELNCWTLELICENIYTKSLIRPTPAEVFEKIIELIKKGLSLNDPIDNTNVFDYLKQEDKYAITESIELLFDNYLQIKSKNTV